MFLRNNTTVVTGSADDTLGIWDALTGKRLFTLSGHTEFICGLACTPDGSIFASSSLDHDIRIWNIATMECVNVIECEDRVDSLVFTPNGDALIAGIGNSHVTMFDYETGDVIHTYSKHPNSDRVYGLAYSHVATGDKEDLASLDILPLHTSIVKAREMLVTQQALNAEARALHNAKLQALRDEYEAKVAALNSRFETKQKKSLDHEAQARAKVDELVARMGSWETSLAATSLANLTLSDVQLLCSRANIEYDNELCMQNQVDGAIFAMCDSDDSMMSTLGVKELGHGARLLKIARLLEAGQPLPVARDITQAGDARVPTQWSVGQTGLWLERVGLAALKPAFEQHLIAGDILFDVDLASLGAILKVPAPQKFALKRELESLRSGVVPDLTAPLLAKPAVPSSSSGLAGSTRQAFLTRHTDAPFLLPYE